MHGLGKTKVQGAELSVTKQNETKQNVVLERAICCVGSHCEAKLAH